MFGPVTSVLAPKGLCKDHRVSYSHSKKEELQCLGGILRCLSNQAIDGNTCIVAIALIGASG